MIDDQTRQDLERLAATVTDKWDKDCCLLQCMNHDLRREHERVRFNREQAMWKTMGFNMPDDMYEFNDASTKDQVLGRIKDALNG